MSMRVIELRQLLQILTMFMIVQFAGLLLAALLFNGATYQQIASAQVVTGPNEAVLFIFYIIGVTAVMILVLKYYTSIYRLFEGFVIFFASAIVFSIITALFVSSTITLLGSQVQVSFVIGGALGLALVAAKNLRPNLRNLAAIIASIGVGVALGTGFSFLTAIVLMMILAAYDFIAVFVTKHMITLANMVQSQNLAFMVDVNEIEAMPKSRLSASELREYNKEVRMLKAKGKPMQKIAQKGFVPLVASVGLGTGDLAVPLMVAIAAYKVSLSFVLSFFVSFGAIIGLVLTMYILRRYRRALPAIPPLLFGIGIGIGLYVLVYGIF